MTLIENESNLAKNYIFDKDKVGLVELTLKNAALAEAIFKNDSRYSKSEDINNGYEEGKSYGTAAYWITQVSNILLNNQELSTNGKHNYEECLKNIINAVDRENGTHLNVQKGREGIFNRLKVIDKEVLLDNLKNPTKNSKRKYEIIEKISEEVNGNKNFSFATKFCHFMCFYLFKGQPEQDNFSIYDDALVRAIPKYYKKYCDKKLTISKIQEKNYNEYIGYIDEIRKCAKEKHHKEISRNAFDHILWFNHKS
jgi:hypothetical protein